MTSFIAFAEVRQSVEVAELISTKVSLLSDFLKGLEGQERSVAANFFLGVVPQPEEALLGIGPSIVSDAIALAAGLSAEKVEALLREIDDSGVATNKAMETYHPLRKSGSSSLLDGCLPEVSGHVRTLGKRRPRGQGSGSEDLIRRINGFGVPCHLSGFPPARQPGG